MRENSSGAVVQKIADCTATSLVKVNRLGPGLNFINVLRADFTRADPESAKKLLDLAVFLRFWDLQE